MPRYILEAEARGRETTVSTLFDSRKMQRTPKWLWLLLWVGKAAARRKTVRKQQLRGEGRGWEGEVFDGFDWFPLLTWLLSPEVWLQERRQFFSFLLWKLMFCH